MRKLASIRRVTQLLPIPNADRIEIAQIDGWQCIVKKGELTPNSLCVYFEIDSFLPKEDRYSFMPKLQTYAGKEGYRVKTMKMRKALSQGLALPLTSFQLSTANEGDDVTELLNIIKYDTELLTVKNGSSSNVRTSGSFPSFIPKTDQERIQNLTSYFTIHTDTEFEETLKLDGSSMTCYKILAEPTLWNRLKRHFGLKHTVPNHFGVCSRNIEIKSNANYTATFDNNGTKSEYKQSNFWEAAIKYRIDQHLPVGYAVQGELIAPNIQNNHEKVQAIEYYIFNVYDIQKQTYLSPLDKQAFVAQYLPEAKMVPVINANIKIFQESPTLEELLLRVEGESLNTGTVSEGRVYVSTDNPTVHFKCISNKYLLKEK